MSSKHRIPRTKDMGFGWRIFIKQITPESMKAMSSDPLPGLWMVDDMTIYIDKNMSYQRKMETYFHELLHAIADIELRARGGI
jgi:Zn-dependent peptidase ImmA (M78 family)